MVLGCQMIRKLNNEEIKLAIITVIKAKRINLTGRIEAVTEEELLFFIINRCNYK